MESEAVGPSPDFRMVGRSRSIEEAEQIALQYEAQGFMTKIIRKGMGGITLYEVWAAKEPTAIN
ncbi:MAG: hypothetical protein ABII71_04835 [Candidatus Micrarchaeota archaeon]